MQTIIPSFPGPDPIALPQSLEDTMSKNKRVSTRIVSDQEITVTVHDPNLYDYMWNGTRRFWISDFVGCRGYVRHVTGKRQEWLGLRDYEKTTLVCDYLYDDGETLRSQPGKSFHALIRKELRKRIRKHELYQIKK